VKRHVPAGDTTDDQKAKRKELIEVKTKLGKLWEAQADKILKKPRKETPISVSATQGGQWESNRRKF